MRAKLPGDPLTGGLWPAIWILGNLARATYTGTSNWVWPWSYTECNRATQRAQLVSGCDPVPHYEMLGGEGRGAPEIDLLEAMPGFEHPDPVLQPSFKKPYFSASLQVQVVRAQQ